MSPATKEQDASGGGSRREIRTIVFLSLMLGIIGLSFQARKVVISEEIFFPQMEQLGPARTCNVSTAPPAEAAAANDSEWRWTVPKKAWHAMGDVELMWRASLVPRGPDFPYSRTAKVAFMFLTKGKLPMAPIWEKFFQGHDGFFSIYLHSPPEYRDNMPENSVFSGRKIPSKRVEWGRSSMVDAERRLLANALLDFSNERFVLLSESCIPLFNFTTIYNYLLNSSHSFLGSFDDPRPTGRGRYNKRMWPTVAAGDWRKGSQWFEVHRKLAVEIVSDTKYYPVFQDHCKPSCYMDEHYLPTLVTMLFPGLNSNRSVTWVDWSAGGSHPREFGRGYITQKFLNHVRFGSKCSYNGKSSRVCFLFARKFVASALEPLLPILPLK